MRKCIACKNKKFKLLEEVDGLFASASILQCRNCGLAFQNPIPSKKQLDKFYSNFYKEEEYEKKDEGTSYPDEMYNKKNKKKEKQKAKAIEICSRSKGKILDVGAGKGHFISEFLDKEHWDAFGIEYSETAVKEIQNRYKLKMYKGEITDDQISNNYFDLITMNSTLEHIPNQQETLKAVNQKLKTGGHFVFNIPNIRSYEYYIFKLLNRSFPGFISQHLFYYTPKSVNILLKNNGFKILKMTSKHPESPSLPPHRPFIGVLNFPLKLLFEYSKLFGKFNFGNALFVCTVKEREVNK